MEYRVYHALPQDAKTIREAVFMKEQGFVEEFDEIDSRAVHLVVYEQETPIAVCRFFVQNGAYVIGRIAVLQPYRGRHIGAAVLRYAEQEIANAGGTAVSLHAQEQAKGFYEKLGYRQFGGIELEEGCPHVWMRKEIR